MDTCLWALSSLLPSDWLSELLDKVSFGTCCLLLSLEASVDFPRVSHLSLMTDVIRQAGLYFWC